MAARYALYFAPAEDTLLWRLGSAWLGRDAASARVLPRPTVDGFSPERLEELTASPRSYGLHATLKAPFALRPSLTVEDLAGAVRSLAARHACFALPRMEVGPLSDFIAVRTDSDCVALQALADACVVDLDGFREPAGEDDVARRRAAGLTSRQEELLTHFGYPFVLDQWRFHITLTGRLTPLDARRLRPWLSRHLADALAPVQRCENLCLFVQAASGADFRLLQRFPLNRH